jgi:excisionase family DNA binding protein
LRPGSWRTRTQVQPCASESPETSLGPSLCSCSTCDKQVADRRTLTRPVCLTCLAIQSMDAVIDKSLPAMLSASISASGLPPVIDAQQASALLACSEGHVERLAESGRLPGTKYGRGWIFVTAQLLYHVAAECAGNLQPPMEPSPGKPSPLAPEPLAPPKRRGRPRRPLSDALWSD